MLKLIFLIGIWVIEPLIGNIWFPGSLNFFKSRGEQIPAGLIP